METIEFQKNTATELERIAWLSAQDHNKVFHSLMHHFNAESLRRCYDTLDGKKAVGTDGIDKQTYGQDLERNLETLVAKMKRMGYRPQPVRQVLIPKEGKPGATRPLGISNFEDKLVQKCMQGLLESIYDPIFLNCSYGFRPNRGCIDAIRDLLNHLHRHEVETVIDVDLANFFGTIDHKTLGEMLQRKIKDTRFLRYINRMFKAGVLANGELSLSDEGVPQGSCCSPVLANIYAHYVIDEWFTEAVKKHSKGQVEMFRYADDLVICSRYDSDAQRIKRALGKRLAKFKLKLNEDKTKLVKFSKREYRQGKKQGTFDFLGFTFYLGSTRRGGITAKVKTSRKRMCSKLKNVNQWARANRNKYPLREIWRRFCAKLRGHIQYYSVSHNTKQVSTFLTRATWILFKWLNRRSQRRSFNWEKFRRFTSRFPLPNVVVKHKLF